VPPTSPILVIDDEDSILEMLRTFLESRSYDVSTASTGAMAISILEERSFDIALIDLRLPDNTGLELVELLNEKHPRTKCIVMTAFATLENTREAFRLNAFDYIIKPFDLVKIGEAVDAAHAAVVRQREHDSKIRELEQASESLNRHVTRLRMLYQMGRDISSNENWSDALDRFLMALCNYMEADGAGLLLFSDRERALKVRTSFHMDTEFLERAVELLHGAQQRDILPHESFHLESSGSDTVRVCHDMNASWEHTAIPLLYKGRWLGFLLMNKPYRRKGDYLNDYHFINTLQTILTEEVANAVTISNLRNLKNFNETILKNINSGVITSDKTGRIIFMNGRASELLGGLSAGTMHFDELFENPMGGGGLFSYLIETGERNRSFETTMKRDAQSRIPVMLNTTAVEFDEYHGTTIVAIFEDLTERKLMEEELKTADRLRSLGELSAGVAHEIRNPLTGIATTAQLLKSKLTERPGEVRYISAILEEISRLDDIINNLLDFARPVSPRPTEIPIVDLIRDATALLAESADEAGVSITVDADLTDDICVLDHDKIKQVVLNIALNGIQACPEGGTLAVRVRDAADPHFIQIEFSDTGEGIPPEVAAKLYDPFFTMRSEGTGLGLSSSRKIIESHGGRINHTSEVGSGTSFFVELPRRMTTPSANPSVNVS
jgi:signal transduction histidine kinase/ActR/RegA family two-component response regulator